jgi:hypothetical protein
VNDGIRRMDIAEFRELGYLQEVNRLVLHPCGLALEVVPPWELDDLQQVLRDAGVNLTAEQDRGIFDALGLGEARFGGVWDYRSDPEGMVFGDRPETEKVANVTRERDRHGGTRIALMGSIIQPLDYPRRTGGGS